MPQVGNFGGERFQSVEGCCHTLMIALKVNVASTDMLGRRRGRVFGRSRR
jgi:hypothetical protein